MGSVVLPGLVLASPEVFGWAVGEEDEELDRIGLV